MRRRVEIRELTKRKAKGVKERGEERSGEEDKKRLNNIREIKSKRYCSAQITLRFIHNLSIISRLYTKNLIIVGIKYELNRFKASY